MQSQFLTDKKKTLMLAYAVAALVILLGVSIWALLYSTPSELEATTPSALALMDPLTPVSLAIVRRSIDSVPYSAAAAEASTPPSTQTETGSLVGFTETDLDTPTTFDQAPQPPETSAPEKVAPPKPRFTVQVGAFREKKYADQRINLLAQKGYGAYLFKAVDQKKQTWYMVRIGRYADLKAALGAKNGFQATEKMAAIITHFNSRAVVPQKELANL